MNGKDSTIPKGTEITAYVSGDTKLDPVNVKAVLESEDNEDK
jgi:hypothetical protein